MSECRMCDMAGEREEQGRPRVEEQGEGLAGMRERARKSLREFGRLLRVAAEFIVLLIAIALPWLFRAATVAFAAWAVSRAYPSLAARLGGDPPAVLLSLAVVLLPLAGALSVAQSEGLSPWGAFMAAGAAIYTLGKGAGVASPLTAALAVGATFSGIVIHALFEYGGEKEQDREEEVSHAEQGAW